MSTLSPPSASISKDAKEAISPVMALALALNEQANKSMALLEVAVGALDAAVRWNRADTPPDFQGDYLIALPAPGGPAVVREGYFLNDQGWFATIDERRVAVTPTHWRRLPDPP